MQREHLSVDAIIRSSLTRINHISESECGVTLLRDTCAMFGDEYQILTFITAVSFPGEKERNETREENTVVRRSPHKSRAYNKCKATPSRSPGNVPA